MKTIAINGSNGFLGMQICKYFENNYHILRINRNNYLIEPSLLAEKIKDADVIINLAGAPIKLFTTHAYMQVMYNSRIATTSNLVKAIEIMNKESLLFISISAVGIYDFYNVHDENSTQYGTDFLSYICKDWEIAVKSANVANTVIIRTGIVLDRYDGFFPKVYKPFKFGVGAILGNGAQPLPFIHILDFLHGIEFVLNRRLNGIVNFAAPVFCSNEEFSRALGKQLRRPVIFRIPSFLIRCMLGKQSSMVLNGQRVIPKVLLENGFKFGYPDISVAITNILNNT